LAQELNTRRELVTERLHKKCREWQDDANFSFEQIFNDELAGHAKVILEQYSRHLAHYAAVRAGYAPVDDELCFPPPGERVVSGMLRELSSSISSYEERFAAIREFFASQHFRRVPGVRISALFWATIARDIHNGRKSDRFPKSSSSWAQKLPALGHV
jgi:hypothetical protein